jgi:hypothetical protein
VIAPGYSNAHALGSDRLAPVRSWRGGGGALVWPYPDRTMPVSAARFRAP